MDSMTKDVFEFRFKLRSDTTTDIPIGYDIESASIISRIKLFFETKLGFEQDIGTGVKNNQQLGCAVK